MGDSAGSTAGSTVSEEASKNLVIEKTSSQVFHLIETTIGGISTRLEVEKAQVYLFCVLIILLATSLISIVFAWKYYAPVIARFEQEEKLRKLKAAERKDE